MPDPTPNASPTTTPTSTNPQPNPAPEHAYEPAAEPPPWLVPIQGLDGPAGVNQSANLDCLALGCDWDWGTVPCRCGRPHTLRICRRCLFCDDPICEADGDNDASGEEDNDDQAVAA
jgi:hypothetical protein